MNDNKPPEPPLVCPGHPDVEPEVGFGLAGGGYGSYLYCPECGLVLQKWQEHDA
jgi:hypothetical protein